MGLDVHVNQTSLVALDQATGELKRARLHTAPSGVIGHLEALAPMRAVYESGPTGLGLDGPPPRLGGVPLRVQEIELV